MRTSTTNRLTIGLPEVIALTLLVAACGDTATTSTQQAAPEAAPTVAEATAATDAEPTPEATAPSTLVPTAPTTTPAATLPPPTTAPPTTALETTTTMMPALPAGSASPVCVNGWTTPEPGTALRKAPLDLIRRDMGLEPTDLFVVDDMRYFVGPEDVWTVEPRRDVERWYVKGYLQDDPPFAGRWLVRRVVGNEGIAGVGSVAPYNSVGYEPGIWVSFYGEADSATSYPGVPGEWWGIPEDPFAGGACTAANGPFPACNWDVTTCSAGANATVVCSGPPPVVMGCLEGT